MTLTIDITREAEFSLKEESRRTGVPMPILASRLLSERLQPIQKSGPKRAPRPGFAADLFAGVDVDALLATPIPGIEEYMPE